MNTVDIEGKEYEVTGYHEDGLPIIRGIATEVRHKDEKGYQLFDEEGNPKISVNVSVPPIIIGIEPGKNG